MQMPLDSSRFGGVNAPRRKTKMVSSPGDGAFASQTKTIKTQTFLSTSVLIVALFIILIRSATNFSPIQKTKMFH
jgi:hypothetical protein